MNRGAPEEHRQRSERRSTAGRDRGPRCSSPYAQPFAECYRTQRLRRSCSGTSPGIGRSWRERRAPDTNLTLETRHVDQLTKLGVREAPATDVPGARLEECG